MKLLNDFHEKTVHSRRVTALTQHLSNLLPPGKVLDVGCGDGLLANLLAERLPDTDFHGIDVLVRENTHIPIDHFDGSVIPFDDNSFDVVMMVDVLHHTDDPEVLLHEAQRVASQYVVLKDHTRDGFLANATLRFMDHVGNAHHGVALPYNYLSRAEWEQAFANSGLSIETWNGQPNMYGKPADWFFGRSLQFIARLSVN